MIVVLLIAPIIYWLVIQAVISAKNKFNRRILDVIKDDTKLVLINEILKKKINLKLHHIKKIKNVITSEEFEFIEKQYYMFVQDKVIIALLSFLILFITSVLYMYFTII